MPLPLAHLYRWEGEDFKGKTYGINARCYWGHIGNLGKLLGTHWEPRKIIGNSLGTWREHVRNKGKKYLNPSQFYLLPTQNYYSIVFINKHTTHPENLQGKYNNNNNNNNGLGFKQYQCKTNTLIWFLI